MSGCTSAGSSSSTTSDTSASAASGTAAASAALAGIEDCETEKVAIGAEGDAIVATIEREAEQRGLTSVLFRVTKGEDLIASGAIGDSVTGVPVEHSMHFRNGAVAFAYMGTLLLLMTESGEVALDDTVAQWLPDLQVPNADTVTLEMLVRNTSGYPDYVPDNTFENDFNANPFQEFTAQDLLDYALAAPPHYDPGTAWSYAHTNYVILGAALEAAGGAPLSDLLADRVIRPMGLAETAAVHTPLLPEPVLHTYSTERGPLEETTFWNPSWQTAPGSVIATNICDMVTSARAIGTGRLLAPASFEAFTSDDSVEHQAPPAGCPESACREFPQGLIYALGVLVLNDWIVQTPLFGGQGSVHAYLPDDDLAVAMVAVTGKESEADVNHAQAIWTAIAAEVTPDHRPPG